MEKVNLDKTFEIWKNKNEENLKEKFLDIHDFYNYLEEVWQEYQQENGLIDESNEYGEEKDEEGKIILIKKIQEVK